MKNIKSALLTLVILASTSTASFAGENHIQNAINHLKQARMQLLKADHGKPGQKEKAIEAIDNAIFHVQQARS